MSKYVAVNDVTLQHSLGAALDAQGNVVQEDSQTVMYRVGEEVDVSKLTQQQQRELRDPRSHLSSLVRQVSDDEQAKLLAAAAELVEASVGTEVRTIEQRYVGDTESGDDTHPLQVPETSPAADQVPTLVGPPPEGASDDTQEPAEEAEAGTGE